MVEPCRENSVLMWWRSPVDDRTGTTLGQVAHDVGVHLVTWSIWFRQAAFDDGDRPGATTVESVGLRAAHERIRVLEPDNEVLRRAVAGLGQANLPER